MAAALCPRRPHPRTHVLSTRNDVDTLIVSDLHLGLPASRPRDLLAVLEQWRFERLILLGDIFHDWSFRHLCADTWRLLAHIRSLSQHSEAEIVWVWATMTATCPISSPSSSVSRPPNPSSWQYGGRSFMALHGDRFDRFISTYVRTSAFFSRVYAFTQRWLSRSGEWPKRLDRAHVGFSNLSAADRGRRPRLRRRATRVDVIVCGHTHQAMRTVFDPPGPGRRPIEYVNTGCWVDRPASFVTVGAGGVALNHCP